MTTDRPARLAVYLINLDRATERLARMTERLTAAGLDFERVPAVDGAALPDPTPGFSPASYALLHGRRRYAPEIGCYFSHVACARRLLDSDATHALILEDDVAFDPDIRTVLDEALKVSDRWNLLRLSTVNDGRKFAVHNLPSGRHLSVALTREKGAGAYVIDRRAAKWITTRLMPMRLAWDIAFDLEYLAGLRALFVDPLPCDQRTEPKSQIQTGVKGSKLPRWRYLTVLPVRAWFEITRLVCRGALWLRLRAQR